MASTTAPVETPAAKVAPLPTIAETLTHPAFPTAIWDLKPDRQGLTPVAEGRGGPINISWEIHGVGPTKLIVSPIIPSHKPAHSLTHSPPQFIMGLGGLKTAWQRQTLHFGHEHRDQYSVLILDNRGMGDSDKPLMRYSTSEMALDIAEVLAAPAVGWLPAYPLPTPPPPRTLHVVGISMGGMIAQELALLIPSCLSSLSLICTAAAVENTSPSFTSHLASRASLLIPKSPDRAVADTAANLFPAGWTALPDDVHLPDPQTTPSCGAPEGRYGRFDTNGERFVAQELHKRRDPGRFGVKGFLLQLVAAGWHHKSAAQLGEMAERVGRERILVMHGTEDGMISVPHGRKLIEFVKPGRGLILEGMGHAPLVERWEWFNGLVGEMCEIGERLDGRGGGVVLN